MNANNVIFRIYDELRASGADPLMVGGCVRDWVMGFTPKDIDTEVHGMNVNTLIEILRKFGRVDLVGMSFGVIKLTVKGEHGGDYDFTLPRRDNKIAAGHKGFMVSFGDMSIEEAAARRDYTCNSVCARAKVVNGKVEIELIDPYNGAEDIRNRILRHTSPAFGEDALRVLRGMQFAGRFDMQVARETAAACFILRPDYEELAIERVWGEWYKWATKSIRPSQGLAFLYATKWVYLWPEISNMIGCDQDPIWHPEGTCFVHSAHTTDAAMAIAKRDGLDEEATATLVFGALCHDMGKPSTSRVGENGRIGSPGHAEAGIPHAISFMRSIGAPEKMVAEVAALTGYHMRHVGGISARGARRMAREMGVSGATTPAMVGRIMEADHSARPWTGAMILPEEAREFVGMMGEAVEAVRPLIMGRDLIAMGMRPGVNMGTIIRAITDAQEEGVVTDWEQAQRAARLMIEANGWANGGDTATQRAPRERKERAPRPAKVRESIDLQARDFMTPLDELDGPYGGDDMTNDDDV